MTTKFVNYNSVLVPFHDLELKPGMHNIDIQIHDGHPVNRLDHSEFVARCFEPGQVVWDIGAYIGTVSIKLAILGGIVHAFEGSRRNATRLELNVAPFCGITVHAIALSDRNATIETKFNDCIDDGEPKQIITLRRIGHYASEFRIPDPVFIKMDIEGMETTVLNTMARYIAEVRPIWQIEYHPRLKAPVGDCPGFISPDKGGFDFNVFSDLGYSVYSASGKPNCFSPANEFSNYFVAPEERDPFK